MTPYEEAIELIRVAHKLNREIELMDETEDGRGISDPFSIRIDGNFRCQIEFMGCHIWGNGDDDDRYSDGDEDSGEDLETIESYVRRISAGHMKLLGRIGEALLPTLNETEAGESK